MYDVFRESVVVNMMTALRGDKVVSVALQGAMDAYARSRGTTTAWGRRRGVPSAVSGKGDGTVPERVHVLLSELGLVVKPTAVATRWNMEAARGGAHLVKVGALAAQVVVLHRRPEEVQLRGGMGPAVRRESESGEAAERSSA